jgi:hypothetical protein
MIVVTVGCGGRPGQAPVDANTVSPDGAELALRPSDVSTLFPVPAGAGDWDLLLPASAVGDRGPVLPRAVWDGMNEPLLEGVDGYDQLHLVAFRIDPCFHGGGASECQAQLRFVWQPRDGADASAHTFYLLTAAELHELVASIAALRGGHDDPEPTVLGVHPVISAEGLGGMYASRLKSLILHYVGASNLIRIAVFSFPGSFPDAQGVQSWRFRAFDVSATVVTARPVAPLSATVVQTFDANAEHARANPPTSATGERRIDAPDVCAALVNVSSELDPALTSPGGAVCSLSAPGADARVRSALRFENPTLTLADTSSCANCHLATTMRLLAEHAFAIDSSSMPERAAPEPDHSGTAQEYFGVTRAFGYHPILSSDGATQLLPAVSVRTANETAAVLARLGTL